jgi:hypothetical protein
MKFPKDTIVDVTTSHAEPPSAPMFCKLTNSWMPPRPLRAMAGDGMPIFLKQWNPVEEIISGTAVYLVNPDGKPRTFCSAILRYTNESHGFKYGPGWILEGDLRCGTLGIDDSGGLNLFRKV